MKLSSSVIVARLSDKFGRGRLALLSKTDKPYEHYEEDGEEIPLDAIESWQEVDLPNAESEDEGIRKEIINYLDFAESHNLLRAADYEKKKGWLAYLEKQKERLTVNGKKTYIMKTYKICPHCKSRMIRDDSKVYTSMPPQYGYNCPKCGAMEFDTVMYDNPEMEEQKEQKPISFNEPYNPDDYEVVIEGNATGLRRKEQKPACTCGNMCGDSRFEVIEKAKNALLESTNIESDEEEMAVLDSFLFRCWQMGWLDRYDEQKPAENSVYPNSLDKAIQLYYYTYGNGKGGFDYLSLPKFQDIVKEFVKNYGQKPAEWSDNFEVNISALLRNKLTWHSEDGSMSTTVLIDDKTLKDIVSGIWFYVKQEQPKCGNSENSNNHAEWSEEDEKILDELLDHCNTENATWYNFLKSFRHQPHWKPTEGQMNKLNVAIACYEGDWGEDNAKPLRELFEQLKKL